ncbi:restriction endonuclease subunit S [Candidatus Woesearchaeota archaeon]|nr:restriction endonuclease subunit S [Candidatus Woesearchaeota archaeon]
MESYSSYKDSGVEWIQKIPFSWNKSRIRMVGKLYGGLTGKKGNDFNNDDSPFNKPFVPFTNIFNNTYISKNHFQYVNIYEGENQNRVLKYDLFFLMSSESYEDLGKCSILLEDIEELYLNSFCKGYRIKDKRVNPLFLNYQLLGSLHKEMISIEGNGFTRINLRQDRLLDIPLFIPPLNEQTQIVSFLDTKIQKIDELIEKTEQKIKLLKEKRTSLINHCVTKGLNPDVEMKDSGVEWIGEIPNHWGTTKLKYQGDVIIGLSYKPENQVDEGQGILVMRSSNVQNGKPSFKDNVYVDCEISEKLKIKENDILICSRNGSRRLIGKNCLIPKEIEGMTWGVFMTVYRSKSPKFFHWLLNSPVFESQSGLFLTSTINQLTVSTLQNMVVPYVYELEEQNQIIEYLNEQTQKIDSTIEKDTQRTELLKEYRQSLISEVVTGKVDVREWNG